MQGGIQDIPRLRLPATGVQTGVMTGGVLVQAAQEMQARHVHERHLLHVQDHTGQRRGQCGEGAVASGISGAVDLTAGHEQYGVIQILGADTERNNALKGLEWQP